MECLWQRCSLPILACVLCMFAGPKVEAQTYVFGTAAYSAPRFGSSSPPSGNQPVVTADLNDDGIPDVAILGTLGQVPNSTQVLSIFLGRPDGTFAARVDYPVQGTGLTVGDFNGDGKLDIVVVGNTGTPSASILFGNGDGTFQIPAPLPNVGSTYTAVTSGDLNGDGKLDLAVLTPDYGSGATLAILLGNGDGTFQPPATYSVPIAPYLVVADLNGDGRPDIGVAGSINGGPTSEVSILINKGDGTFQAPVNYPISGIIEALAAADLNGDGKLDLIVPTGGASAGFSVLLGNGDGTFGNAIAYSSSLLDLYSSQIAIADFNGDGRLDLALTNSQTNDIAIVLGNGDGTFQSPPKIYSGGLQPSAVLALDANGDNKPDLAIAGGYASDFLLTVLINRGDGSFPNRITYPVLSDPYSAVVADFNADGHSDIATTSDTQSGGVSVLMGNSDGTFQPHLDSPTGQNGNGTSPTLMVAGDLNNDHKFDLVVADIQQTPVGASYPVLATLMGNGDGTFQNLSNQILTNIVSSLVLGDFNNDGNLDAVGTSVNTSSASIFLGKGDGTFASPASISVGPMLLSPPYHNVLADDFNGDSKLDLAVATDNGVAVLLGNGDGTFQPANVIPPLDTADPGDELLGVGDFNGDGKPDIVKGTQTDILNVALGNGDGTFQNAPGLQFPSIVGFESAQVGDFNSDGKLDVAFASQSSNVMIVLLGNGDGTFCCHIYYHAGSISNNVRFMTAADFDGDGAQDLAFTNFGDSTVSVFVNTPIAAFAPRQVIFANQDVGSTSAAQPVTLTNSGAAPLNITNIGTNGDFSQTNDCPAKLSVGAACQINVTFSPAAEGTRTGSLTFTDNGSVVPQVLNLSGAGVQSSVTLSSTGITFSSQAVGTTSAPQIVTVANGSTGNVSFSAAAVTISGTNASEFAISSDGCSGQTIAPNGSCSVATVFKPLTAGNKSATLSFADSALGSPQIVDLAGSAAVPDFAIGIASGSSASATVTAGATATFPLTAAPVGGFNQTISLACTGAPALATCSASPASVALDGTDAVALKVSITTTAPGLLPPASPDSFPLEMIMIGLCSLLASVYLALSSRTRLRAAWLALIPVVLVATGLCVSCGGHSGSAAPGTPAGTYTIIVTGTSGALSHSQTLTLTVN